VRIRSLVRDEIDTVLQWAAQEGWNPGDDDAEVFWNTDPGAFVGVEVDGQLIGSGSIVSYGGRMGFVGLFIVRPEFRGRGYGKALWDHMLTALPERLDPGAPMALDGVKDMEDRYRLTGFRSSHDDRRMRLVSAATRLPSSVRRITAPVGAIAQWDSQCFGVPRPTFLSGWLGHPDHVALAYVTDSLRGYAVMRPCQTGHRIGPLFAADVAAAETLLTGLFAHVPVGSELFLDVPDSNVEAMRWAGSLGGTEVFTCARMYTGTPPRTDWSRVFGVTTLELG